MDWSISACSLVSYLTCIWQIGEFDLRFQSNCFLKWPRRGMEYGNAHSRHHICPCMTNPRYVALTFLHPEGGRNRIIFRSDSESRGSIRSITTAKCRRATSSRRRTRTTPTSTSRSPASPHRPTREKVIPVRWEFGNVSLKTKGG